ncbi:MAG: acyl-CoA dehydrogenase family protein [Planctomycetota bacterium]|nr:acyl-CoA dehydrogenase family protein [Planctomycetota bacterium]
MIGPQSLVYDLTPEQAVMRQRAKEFAEAEVEPVATDYDVDPRFPHELFAKMAESGLTGAPFPKKFGGEEVSYLEYVTMVEEVARVDAAAAVVMMLNYTLAGKPILFVGSEEQQQRWIPDLVTGKRVGAFALSEPVAGSDASAMRTIAIPDGDDYVLTGEKHYTTSGDVADLFVIAAQVPVGESWRFAAFVLDDPDTPGFHRRRLEHKLGIRMSTMAKLRLEDVRIPAANMLGRPGKGFQTMMRTLDGGRVGISGQAIGVCQRAVEESVAFSTQRHAFGGPIATLGAIQVMLADMATQCSAARALVYRVAQMFDAGDHWPIMASQAKLFASRAANFCAYQNLQIHGGYGYFGELSIADRLFRDARILEIYEGTSQIQQLIISRSLTKEDAEHPFRDSAAPEPIDLPDPVQVVVDYEARKAAGEEENEGEEG